MKGTLNLSFRCDLEELVILFFFYFILILEPGGRKILGCERAFKNLTKFQSRFYETTKLGQFKKKSFFCFLCQFLNTPKPSGSWVYNLILFLKPNTFQNIQSF